jgi:hypothetical protein
MRRSVSALCLALGLAALPVAAQETAGLDCAALTEGLRGIDGYDLTVPPAGTEDRWCVLDGAALRSRTPGWPSLSAETLRIASDGASAEVALSGLRVAPALGDRTVDDRLRTLFRLQTADLTLSALHDAGTGRLSLSRSSVILSGGSALRLTAEIDGASLDPASIPEGTLKAMTLEWDSDGRLLRPVMELIGDRLTGAEGGEAVDAARVAFAGLVAALPDAAVDEDARRALEAFVEDLPQGKGRLVLSLEAPDGIGAARIAIAALAGDPMGPEALARLLAGVTITARWQPGLAP